MAPVPNARGRGQRGRTMEDQDGTRNIDTESSSPDWASVQGSAIDRSDEYRGGSGRPTWPVVAAVLRRNLERPSRLRAQPREIPAQGRGVGSGAPLCLVGTKLDLRLPSKHSRELRLRHQRTATTHATTEAPGSICKERH